MSTVTSQDGTLIYFKDWGPKSAPPLVFHHGWPLSADDWDSQMLCFVGKGYRVIAHDRRGHGRSSQVSDGRDMDHYAADAAVVEHLDVRNAVHIGHSTGGGEATRDVARHGQKQGRVAKVVLIGAVPPLMLKTAANPGGLPIEVFDGVRMELAANRAPFYLIAVPTLVMHGDDDQIVPVADSALLSAKLLKRGALKVYDKYPHGMCTTHADLITADLLAFLKS